MSFASLHFLFLFLPLFFLFYYSALVLRAGNRALNLVALGGSLLFYTWGAPDFVPLLLLSCLVDFVLSRLLVQPRRSERERKALVGTSILLNVGSLFYFKYSNFFVEQSNLALTGMGFSSLPWTAVVLPIGISFITFEKLSYIVDVFRGKTAPAPNFSTYLLFIALFPHLIAGPIFRYHDMAYQLTNRSHSLEDIRLGIIRFRLGLSKKVLIADSVAILADRIFSLPVTELSFARAWFGILAYTFQIYFDFSGYSDMAIGLGRMMGFRFTENFNHPYISQNITEFWRRWHISLSNWLREYLYFPLGGNRLGPIRTYLNLWIVFLVSGFWHGANWTFLLWGCFHGFFLMLDKLFLIRLSEKFPSLLRTGLTFFLIVCSWVIFRSESVGFATTYFGHLFAILPAQPTPQMPLLYELTPRNYTAFFAAIVLSFFPLVQSLFGTSRPTLQFPILLRRACLSGVALLLFFLSAAALTTSSFHPFIYFQF